jgi:hypothetical protein
MVAVGFASDDLPEISALVKVDLCGRGAFGTFIEETKSQILLKSLILRE